jgi:hypothetical protein
MDSNLIARLEAFADDYQTPYGAWTGEARELLREAAAALRGAEDAPLIIECSCCGDDAWIGQKGDDIVDGTPLACGCKGWISCDSETEPYVSGTEDCDCQERGAEDAQCGATWDSPTGLRRVCALPRGHVGHHANEASAYPEAMWEWGAEDAPKVRQVKCVTARCSTCGSYCDDIEWEYEDTPTPAPKPEREVLCEIGEFVVARGAWIRDDGRTCVEVQVADGANLSSRGARRDALLAAARATAPTPEPEDGR